MKGVKYFSLCLLIRKKKKANCGTLSGGKETIINEPKIRIMSLSQSQLKTIRVFPPASKTYEAYLASLCYLTELWVKAVVTIQGICLEG